MLFSPSLGIPAHVLQTVEYLLIGIILASGLAWQKFLFEKDKYNSTKRIEIARIFTLVIMLGLGGHGMIALFDDRAFYTVEDLFDNLFKAGIFSLAFVIKAWLAPLLLTATIAVALYHLFEYQELQAIPLLSAFLDWVFSALSKWLEALYIIALGLYAFSTAIYDSFHS